MNLHFFYGFVQICRTVRIIENVNIKWFTCTPIKDKKYGFLCTEMRRVRMNMRAGEIERQSEKEKKEKIRRNTEHVSKIPKSSAEVNRFDSI